MSRTQSTIVCSLKRQHHLLWLLLGLGFSLWLVFQLGQDAVTSVILLVGLLATYCTAGQWAARLIARSVLRWSIHRLSWALMSSSLKFGVLFSLLSALFHLTLLGFVDGNGAPGLLPHATASILLRAAIFPFLACLGAACTASSALLSESTDMVQYPKNQGFTTLTD